MYVFYLCLFTPDYQFLVAATYSLDQMSDDEDLDSVRVNPGQGGQAITASQLAAALMAAGGMQAGVSERHWGIGHVTLVAITDFTILIPYV